MSTDTLIGTEIAGHRIERLIGRGGGGAVYLAEHLQLRRKVALKLLPPELAADEVFRRRFTWEARTAATLQHPGIVTVFDAGEADGVLFISMLHVDGVDLAQLLMREGTMESDRVLAILSPVAVALDAAHERGFVHRDVKPANILVKEPAGPDTPTQVYLSDFGIAKPLHTVEGPTKTGEFVGSVNYVAPEQIQGEPLDGRADQYSLGCMLVECLTGQVPFPREVGVAAIYAHLDAPPPSLHERRPSLPLVLDGVIARALSKSPVERYDSCVSLIEAVSDAFNTPLSRFSKSRAVRKVVTVLCLDVAEATSRPRHLDSEFEQMTNVFFERADDCIRHHGGHPERLPGGAVMAVFGVPRVHEDDALRAVRAAFDMRNALEEVNAGFEADGGLVLVARTAVNTGEVIAQDESADFVVAGGGINLAVRLQQLAEPGEILLSGETHSLVRDAVRVDLVDDRVFPGEPAPSPAYRLEHVLPDAPGIARRFDVPLVGRSRELVMLQQAFDRSVSDRACHMFTVLGPAGVGKTRLVEAFLTDISDRARIVGGRCLSYGEGITLWPIIELVSEAAGLSPSDPRETVRRKLEGAAGPVTDPRVLDRVELVLGRSELDVPSEEIFWSVRRFIEGLAAQGPVVISFDDLHWGEPTFLDLVEHLAGWISDSPILLLGQARPELVESRPGWGGGQRNATTILLEPLPDDDITVLIDALMTGGEVDPTVHDRITRAAGGMPLYLEQILSMLVERGLLLLEADRWVPSARLKDLDMPATVEALISARLDELDPIPRLVLEHASLIGQVFRAEEVSHLAGLSIAQVNTVLADLVRKDLIRPVAGELGEDAFRFGHMLTVEAAYGRLTTEERAELHERFADWLQATSEELPMEVDEFVGYHLEQAWRYARELGSDEEAARRLAERAANSLVTSGERALGRSDVRTAAGLFQRARSLLPDAHPAAVRTSALLADVLYDTGDLEPLEEILAELPQRARAVGDEQSAARAVLVGVLVDQLAAPDALAGSINEVKALLPSLRGTGDDGALAEAYAVMCLLLYWIGDCAGALEANTSAMRHARDSGRSRSLAQAIACARMPLVWGPTPTIDAIAIAHELRNEGLAHGLMMYWMEEVIAALTAMRGDFDAAFEWLRLSRETIKQLDLGLEAKVATRRGVVEFHAGKYEDLEHTARDAIATMESLGAFGYAAGAANMLADALLGQGRAGEAIEVTEMSERWGQADDFDAQLEWRRLRAEALAALGSRLREAEGLARRSIELAHSSDYMCSRGDSHRALASVLKAQDRDAEASAQLVEALRDYETKDNLVMMGRIRERLDDV